MSMTPRDRINALVREAVEKHGGNPAAAVAQLATALLETDVATLWEFFTPDRNVRLWAEVEEARRQIRVERGLEVGRVKPGITHPSGHIPGASHRPSGPAANVVMPPSGGPAAGPAPLSRGVRRAAVAGILYGPQAVRINDVPIGLVRAGVARQWGVVSERNGRFARLLTEGLTDDMVIGEYRSEAEAEQVWRLAGSN